MHSLHLGTPLSTNSNSVGELQYCCPDSIHVPRVGHPDEGYHLYVNIRTGLFFCQRCRFGGKLKELQSERRTPELETLLNLVQEMNRISTITTYSELPSDFCPISDGIYKDYVYRRGITDAQIEFYRLGWSSSVPWRVIFPCYMRGKLVTWTGRSVLESLMPRYSNAPASESGKCLYNYDGAYGNDQVIITEGPISAIMAGYNAIATFSVNYTGYQVDLIQSLNAKSYVVAYDGEALDQSYELANYLYKRGLIVSIAEIPYKEDPASLEHSKFMDIVRTATPFNRVSKLLRDTQSSLARRRYVHN